MSICDTLEEEGDEFQTLLEQVVLSAPFLMK